MKKTILGLLFAFLGCGLWWSLANTARFSIKKWDAKFESVLRSSLHKLKLDDSDIISSVHEVNKDKDGKWVVHRLEVELDDPEQLKDLQKSLKKSGAHVEMVTKNKQTTILVKRGSRIYQEIKPVLVP